MLHQKTTQEPKFLCLQEGFLDLTLTTMSLDGSCLVREGPPVYHIKPQLEQLTRVSGSCNGLVCIFDEHSSLTNPIIVANNTAMVRSQTLPLSGFQRHCLEDKKNNSENLLPRTIRRFLSQVYFPPTSYIFFLVLLAKA